VAVVTEVRRFRVYLAALDPTQGAEIRKTRPCVVVSPDEMNRRIRTVIIAPMTTVTREYPTRVPLRFRGKSGEVVLDQIRAVDRSRLAKGLGALPSDTARRIAAALVEMFALA
jgi:mRNA interferase MazF